MLDFITSKVAQCETGAVTAFKAIVVKFKHHSIAALLRRACPL